jgi:2-dehydropantoate 2-reductase
MRLLIVGPGAMGCLFAAGLKRAGFEVTLLDYRLDRAEALNNQGILVTGATGDHAVRVPVLSAPFNEQPDFVLICVKAYSTVQAAKALQEYLPPDTGVITLQNGIGNVEILREIFGENRVYGGVTAEGATLLEPGKIQHAGRGETVIGPTVNRIRPLEEVVKAFNQAGFQTRTTDNVESLIWGKLIINVGINALTAITRLKNGRLPEIPGTRFIMERAVEEAAAVARAENIALPYPDPFERVAEVCRATAENIASMLQDVLKGKITEVDAINGAIVRKGEARGIPTPVNRTLAALVGTIQETYLERI